MTAWDREQALSNLALARQTLLAAIDGLSDEQLSLMGCLGSWAAKDVLSHVASWDEACARDFRRIASGDTPGLAGFREEHIDDYNRVLMAFRSHLPAAQVRRELAAARIDVQEALKAMPDAQLAEGQFARALTDIQAGHDRDHAEHIGRWRREQGL